MNFLNKRKAGGLMDQIYCDESSYLVWKWHPYGADKGNHRENAIRYGSSLRVKDGEVAILVCNEQEEIIFGPCDTIVKTSNFPVLADVIGVVYDSGTPFPAEVYFINLAEIIHLRVAVPYFEVYDSEFKNISVPVAVRGSISFMISDYLQFIGLHRLRDFNLDDFKREINDAVVKCVKDIVVNIPNSCNISVIHLETRIGQISDMVEITLRNCLQEKFGVTVSEIDISAIDVDKTSNGYYRLMNSFRNTQSITNMKEVENFTPPPLPYESYYVAIDGKAQGPFEISVLQRMVTLRQITRDCLVWKKGMSDWKRADLLPELKGIFGDRIPPIPK